MNYSSDTSSLEANSGLQQRDILSRVFSLDVLRGIALLGILIISIWRFGGFSGNEQTQLRAVHRGGNDQLFAAVSILFEGKMRALFSLVFGAGIILFMSRARHPSDLPAPDLFIRRQMWLIAFGIFNAVVLLWPGDILFHYGVLGILLFTFWRMSPRQLIIAALVAVLIFCGKNYWNYNDDRQAHKKYLAIKEVEKKFSKDSIDRFRKDSIWVLGQGNSVKNAVVPLVDSTNMNKGKDTIIRKLQNDSLAKEAKKDTLTKKQKTDKQKWEDIVKSTKYDSAAVKMDIKAMRAGYGKIWNHLLPGTQFFEASWLYTTGIWDIGSMMLLGMSLYGFGFFSGKYSIKKYLLIAIPALLLGLLLAWLRQQWLHEKAVDYARYVTNMKIPGNQFFPVERMLLVVAYASLLMIFIRARVLNRLWKALAATGRMAFTNYLMQTIVCTLFFYGYGMGNFGRLSQLQLYFVVLEIWMVQVIFSVVWFRQFNIGPLEWLWRRLTYGKWLPIRKENQQSASKEITTN